MICKNIDTVSIITPSYQQRAYIEQTLRSVIEQEGDFDLDYIVVDGGSTDGTVDVLKDFAHQLESGQLRPGCRKCNFRWLSERDTGQASAINKGFRLATGEVFAWLNSDDTYASNQAIAKCTNYFRNHADARFVYGKGYGIDAAGSVTGEEQYVTEFLIDDLPEIDMILQPATFWRHEVYEKIGLLNESLHFVLDWDYWLRCQQHFRLEFLDEFLACNRRYAENKTGSGGMKRKREIAELLLTSGKFTQRDPSLYLAEPIYLQGVKKRLSHVHSWLQAGTSKESSARPGNRWLVRSDVQLLDASINAEATR